MTLVAPTSQGGDGDTRRATVRRAPDAGAFLTAYVVLLFAVRPTLVISPLGSMGSPALLVGVLGLAWWTFAQVARATPSGRGVQPVRWALGILVACFLASFAVATHRPISGQEMSTATVGMVSLASWAGVLLLAEDGLSERGRFDAVLRRLTLAGVALGLLGIAQFAFHDPLWAGLRLPGLRENALSVGVTSRNGFARPAGTAVHPIEFGAVLTMLLPSALVLARRSATVRQRRWWMVGVAIMGLAIVLAISRSALLCSLIGLAVLAARWTWAERARLLAAVLVLGGAVSLVIPGLLGTLLGLFVTAGDDSSVASRTSSYGIAGQFFARAPLLGRGYATFLPSYRIFDNQYLLLLIEVGLVGTLAFAALLVTGAVVARRTARLGADLGRSETSQGLMAGVVGGAVGLVMYDGLSFPLATGVLFLVLGLVAADRSLTRASR